MCQKEWLLFLQETLFLHTLPTTTIFLFSLSIKLVKDISQRRFQNVNYRVAQWLLRQHCEYCVSGRQGMVIGKYELVSFLPA